MKTITLTPAFGKDFKSCRAVRKSFLDGDDFVVSDLSHIHHGRYCSIRDFRHTQFTVYIRFNKEQNLCRVNKEDIQNAIHSA